MTAIDIEKKISELITNRDYKNLMELAQFDEDERIRNMALFAIGQLSQDESIKGNINKTLTFLSQIIHLDIFPTDFGEFESFMASGYFDGGTLSMAASQLIFLPQWNKNFQNENINEILFTIASENSLQSVQLSCATALLLLEDRCCLEFFEENLTSLDYDQDYRYRAHCLFAIGWFWNQCFPDDRDTFEKRTNLIIKGMTPIIRNGTAFFGWQTEIQWAGANSLGCMADKRVFPILESLVKRHSDSWLEDDIILAMGRLKDPRAEPYLQKLIKQQNQAEKEIDAANIVKFMRGIDTNDNIKEAKKMIANLDEDFPDANDSYYIDYSTLDTAKFVESAGPMQDQFKKDMDEGKIFSAEPLLDSTNDKSIEFTPEQIKRLYEGKNPFGDD